MSFINEAFQEHATQSEEHRDTSNDPRWVDPTGGGREVGDSQYINTNNTRRGTIGNIPGIDGNYLRELKGSDEDIRGFGRSGPGIMDRRYDASEATQFYRQNPNLYGQMSQYYSNPQLFGFPSWWENWEWFGNYNMNCNSCIYIAIITGLIVLCFLMKKK